MELLEKRLLLASEAAHDHAVDADAGQPADLPGEERAPADRHERLRAPARRVTEALGLAARQHDRLHQSRPFVAARPIASYR
jgi:hypothetical protein